VYILAGLTIVFVIVAFAVADAIGAPTTGPRPSGGDRAHRRHRRVLGLLPRNQGAQTTGGQPSSYSMSDSEPDTPAEETEHPAPAREGFFRRLVKLFGSGPTSMGGVGAGRWDEEQPRDTGEPGR
jgi:hypothetical protein